jgi:hypothetical protein
MTRVEQAVLGLHFDGACCRGPSGPEVGSTGNRTPASRIRMLPPFVIPRERSERGIPTLRQWGPRRAF